MKVQDFLKNLGYDITIHDYWRNYIELWKSWYKGKVSSFHWYSVYNGQRYVKLERLSLQVAKFVSEKMADLLYNEKVKITLGDEKSTETLNNILESVGFEILMNRGIEKSFAMGTGCVIADIDNISINDGTTSFENSSVSLGFVNAENIYPLTWSEKGIKELAIIEEEKLSDGNKNIVIKLYVIKKPPNYTICNFKFRVDKENNIINATDDVYIREFETGTNMPWFSIIMPNIVNNIDLYSPYGISIFANSIDVLKSIDMTFDSLNNEIHLGRKRLLTTKEMMRINTITGQEELNFDPNDIIFHVVGDGLSAGTDKYFQEINGDLRIDEHIKTLDANIRILGSKTGFGSDYFSFNQKTLAPKTATEVVSENSELFRTIKKHEKILEHSLRTIIHAIKSIGILTGKFNIDDSTINIDFDDSVVESKTQERAEDRQDLAQDTLSRIDYVMKWRGLDRESATEKINEIDREKPAKEGITFLDGEIN